MLIFRMEMMKIIGSGKVRAAKCDLKSRANCEEDEARCGKGLAAPSGLCDPLKELQNHLCDPQQWHQIPKHLRHFKTLTPHIGPEKRF